MKKKQSFILSLCVYLCLAAVLLPLSGTTAIKALTQQDGVAIEETSVVSFDALPNDIAHQSFVRGKLNSFQEAELPDTLKAKDKEGKEILIQNIVWNCTAFQSSVLGSYTVTASLPPAYHLAEDCLLPEIQIILTPEKEVVSKAIALNFSKLLKGEVGNLPDNPVTTGDELFTAIEKANLDSDTNTIYIGGDEIVINKELPEIKNPLNIIGVKSAGEKYPILKTGGDFRHFKIYNVNNAIHNVTISNLTLCGTDNPGSSINGGIECKERKGVLTLTNLTIKDCFIGSMGTTYGAGLNSRGKVNIESCSFENNEVENNEGGAVYLSGTSGGNVKDSIFSFNKAKKGGGLSTAASTVIDNCTFNDNESTGTQNNDDGGAILGVNNPTMTIQNSVFTNNTSQYYGGAIRVGGNADKIINCSFEGNSARYSGGAIYTANAKLVTSNSKFIGNRTQSQYGGAIYAITNTTINDSYFFENSASEGGAVYSNGKTTISGTTFYKNTSNNNGGGLRSLTVYISNSSFIENEAKSHGGALYTTADNNEVISSAFLMNKGKSTSNATGNSIFNDNLSSVFNIRGSVFVSDSTLPEVYFGTGPWVDADDNNDGISNNYNIIGKTFTLQQLYGTSVPELTDNGGFAPTVIPSFNSPMMDAIPALETWLSSTDQRGFKRPNKEKGDIGPIELQQPDSFTITPSIKTMVLQDTQKLKIEDLAPENTDNKKPNWSSNHPDIISIDDDGNIEAKAVGTATITAKIWNCTQTITISVLRKVADTPVITQQPQTATYSVGQNATALTVKATATDNGKLTYQWYQSKSETDKGSEIKGATKNIFIPSTDDLGTTFYTCLITNTSDSAADTAAIMSKSVSITVEPYAHDVLVRPNVKEPLDLSKDAVFVIQGEYDNIKEIRLQGHKLMQSPIDHKKAELSGYPGYTSNVGSVSSGSVRVTLYKEFLRTLITDTYTLEVEFLDGNVESTCSIEFFVQYKPSEIPPKDTLPSQTSDTSNPILWLFMMLLTYLGSTLLFKKNQEKYK